MVKVDKLLFVKMFFVFSLYHYDDNHTFFFLKLGSPDRFDKSTSTRGCLEFDSSSTERCFSS
jgi:hypothetical protein